MSSLLYSIWDIAPIYFLYFPSDFFFRHSVTPGQHRRHHLLAAHVHQHHPRQTEMKRTNKSRIGSTKIDIISCSLLDLAECVTTVQTWTPICLVHWDDLTTNANGKVHQLPHIPYAESKSVTCQSQLWWMTQHAKYGNYHTFLLCPSRRDADDWSSGAVRLWVWLWCHNTLASVFQKQVLVEVAVPAEVHLDGLLPTKYSIW